MGFRHTLTIFCLLAFVTPGICQEKEAIYPEVSSGLDHVFDLYDQNAELDTDKLKELVTFVRESPDDLSLPLAKKKNANGSFYVFSVNIDMDQLLNYAYNPDIPAYLTAPSSIQYSKWLDQDSILTMKSILEQGTEKTKTTLFRGQDSETITPDTNTGGYYTYTLDRIMALIKDQSGPVFLSASRQSKPSDVGKKGCVAGNDNNWDYLYSEEVGLNKMGLGWVDSYMYRADSIIVYAADLSKGIVKVGLFKWLDAGWAKMNMVNSSHILEGTKRFATSFKTVLESPSLPEADELIKKQQELVGTSQEELRTLVTPYIEKLISTDAAKSCSGTIKKQLESGEYVQQMSPEEMVRILLLKNIQG